MIKRMTRFPYDKHDDISIPLLGLAEFYSNENEQYQLGGDEENDYAQIKMGSVNWGSASV